MKINVFPITSPLHDEQTVIKDTNELINNLKDELDCQIELCFDVDKLYDSDLALIFVRTGGSENTFLSIIDKLKEPNYFLTVEHSNSLAASLEILTYLNLQNKKGEILHGNVHYLSQRIKELLGE